MGRVSSLSVSVDVLEMEEEVRLETFSIVLFAKSAILTWSLAQRLPPNLVVEVGPRAAATPLKALQTRSAMMLPPMDSTARCSTFSPSLFD